MFVFLITVFFAALCFAVFAWRRNTKNKTELQRHSISPQELHESIRSGGRVLLFDVRQPLDLLAYPEQIPGAQRIPPAEVLEKPSLIPKDQDAVVYCTCPSDKTSRMVLDKALALGFSRIRFLRGGLAAWKGVGFPVEPYTGTFSFSAEMRPG
jgi:rhodanese-related sulfurtransferase